MKKFLLTLLLGAASLTGSAAGYSSVVVHCTDGTSVCIAMESDMQARVLLSTLELSCQKGYIEFPAADVNKLTFSTEPGDNTLWGLSAIGDVAVDGSIEPGVTRDGSVIRVTNLPDGSKVSVVTMAGAVVTSAVVSGEYTMPVDDFTAGVYIVTVNDKSFKIAINR